jgi:tetratricopeptide (TPR) repeat protein/transcriptional regulator with XRE-family HTH domain
VEERTNSFGYWLRRRRKALDLTQEALAQSVSCSRFAIRKIEADERRPSRRLAERLAERLAVPEVERDAFLGAARAVRSMDQLQVDAQPLRSAAAGESGQAAAAGMHELRDSPALESSIAAGNTPLVGRLNEFGQLVGLLARLTSSEGHVGLIEGEAGIGKSRLLQEISRYASERSICTLHTNCYEIERAMPYQPVIDLVGQAVDLCTTATLQTLPPIALAEIAALVPAAGERFPNLPALSTDFPEARQVRLFGAIVRLLDVLGSGRQLMITVDDIHWVDDTSRQFLHYLARHVPARPLLLILAYRGEEVNTDENLTSFIQSLGRETHASHFPLARLSVADAESMVARLAQERLRTSGLGAWLHRESEGNPLFMTSILYSLAEQNALPVDSGGQDGTQADFIASSRGDHPLPEALRASVRARINRVPRETRAKLEIAAVLGRRFDFELLQAVTNEPQATLLDAIDLLVRRQLLREEQDGGVYDFSHDKVREVVYLDIGSTRRMLLHRTVAEAIERSQGHELHERTASLAEHYVRGQVWSKGIRYLVQAAEQSQRLFAMRPALRWFDRAVTLADAHPDAMEEQERLALIEQRGVARAMAGQTAGAVADFERVIDVARGRGENERVRNLLIELGMTYRRADAYEQATGCLNEALAASRAMGDDRHAADTLYHLGTVAWSNGRNRHAIQYHQEAVEICERLGLSDLVAVQAFHGRGEAHFANAEPMPAIECFTRSLDYARGIGDRSYESENLMMIGWASLGIMGSGNYTRARDSYEAALTIARAADLQWHLGPTFLGRDHVRGCLGDYASAWTGMNETLRRLQALKLVRYQIMAHELMGHLLLDLNNNEKAAVVLEQGLAISRDANILYWRPGLQASQVMARVRCGEIDLRPELDKALAAARDNSERYQETRCLEALTELMFARGEFGACMAVADELLAIAQPNDMRELTVVALRWRGEALMADRSFDQARGVLTQAGDLAELIGRPRLSWDIHRSLARLAHGLGAIEEEKLHRGAAQEIAERIAQNLRGSELRFDPVPDSESPPGDL